MRSVIKAAIRLLALFFGIGLFFQVLNTLISGWQIQDMSVIFFCELLLIVVVGFGILFLMWNKSDWLVKVLAGNIDDNTLVIRTSNSELMSVAFRITGFYIFINSLPLLVSRAVVFFIKDPYYSASNELRWLISGLVC
jgi:hypothetical protein